MIRLSNQQLADMAMVINKVTSETMRTQDVGSEFDAAFRKTSKDTDYQASIASAVQTFQG